MRSQRRRLRHAPGVEAEAAAAVEDVADYKESRPSEMLRGEL